MALDLFRELIPSLMQGKEPLLEEEKDYNPWMVNSALSYHFDCVLYAQEMNMNYNLDKKMQHDYLFHSLRKYKRKYQTWNKKVNNQDLSVIKEYFGYSNTKAKEALNILTTEQIGAIKLMLEKGGLKK